MFKTPLFLFLAGVLLFPLFSITVKATGIPSPTLLDVEVTPQKNLKVEGLTPNKSKVLVYINGKFKSLAKISEISDEEVNSFRYLSSSPMSPGRHDLTVVSQKQNSTIMSPPVNYDFAVYGQPSGKNNQTEPDPKPSAPETSSYKTPAPTLLPLPSQTSTNTQPSILGLTTNGTKVKVYVDGTSMAATEFLYHSSGTAGFTLTSSQELPPGKHKIWAQAIDKGGKISQKSNVLDFNITAVKGEKTISLKTPQLLTPLNGTTTPLSELIISGQVDQIVDAFNIYINKKVYTQVDSQISDKTSRFSYQVQDLDRGPYNLYITSVKEGKESPSSSQVVFTVTKPRIDQGVQEKKTSATSVTEDLATTSVSATTSPTLVDNFLNFLRDIKYILFGLVILGIIIWLIWINKDTIKNSSSTKNKQ